MLDPLTPLPWLRIIINRDTETGASYFVIPTKGVIRVRTGTLSSRIQRAFDRTKGVWCEVHHLTPKALQMTIISPCIQGTYSMESCAGGTPS